MATFQDGGRKRATANTVAAQVRSAERHRCPKCGRKSAVKNDAEMRMTYCRWTLEGKCDYVENWDD